MCYHTASRYEDNVQYIGDGGVVLVVCVLVVCGRCQKVEEEKET